MNQIIMPYYLGVSVSTIQQFGLRNLTSLLLSYFKMCAVFYFFLAIKFCSPSVMVSFNLIF